MRKKLLVSVAVVALLLLLAVASAGAVTWGEPDQGAHPYVGTLLFQQGGGLYSCSGTLLSPTVMVTAGHCTEEGGVPNTMTYVRFEEDALTGIDNYRDANGVLDLGAWLANDWIAATAIPHSNYDDFNQFPATYDVGIVILSEPVYPGTYAQLPELGFLETLTKGQGQKNDQFTVVGYGMQGYIKPFEMDIWARYKGTVSLVELNSTFAGGHSAKFTNNPGHGNGSGGSCFGDSGGPVFYGDTTVIAAVVSWGNSPCIGVDYQFRLDTAIAQDFIRPYLG